MFVVCLERALAGGVKQRDHFACLWSKIRQLLNPLFPIIHMQMQTTLKVYLALAGVVTASSTRVVPPSTAIKDTLSKRTVSRPHSKRVFFLLQLSHHLILPSFFYHPCTSRFLTMLSLNARCCFRPSLQRAAYSPPLSTTRRPKPCSFFTSEAACAAAPGPVPCRWKYRAHACINAVPPSPPAPARNTTRPRIWPLPTDYTRGTTTVESWLATRPSFSPPPGVLRRHRSLRRHSAGTLPCASRTVPLPTG